MTEPTRFEQEPLTPRTGQPAPNAIEKPSANPWTWLKNIWTALVRPASK
jgi:hypothetical protein